MSTDCLLITQAKFLISYFSNSHFFDTRPFSLEAEARAWCQDYLRLESLMYTLADLSSCKVGLMTRPVGTLSCMAGVVVGATHDGRNFECTSKSMNEQEYAYDTYALRRRTGHFCALEKIDRNGLCHTDFSADSHNAGLEITFFFVLTYVHTQDQVVRAGKALVHRFRLSAQNEVNFKTFKAAHEFYAAAPWPESKPSTLQVKN